MNTAPATTPAAWDPATRLVVRRGAERGQSRASWLRSFHSFSFGEYYDPAHMGYRALRVINEDWIDAGRGFGTHPHRDMEILSWVLSGELEHRDSLGHGAKIRPGESQKMTAGTGIRHSEFATADAPVHLIQIWVLPERTGLEPSYEQKTLAPPADGSKMQLMASRDGRDGSVRVHQDLDLYRVALDRDEEASYEARRDRYHWLQVTRGAVEVGELRLAAGDAVAVENSERFSMKAVEPASEVLLFDLA